MSKYFLGFYSFASQEPQIVEAILAIPLIQRLIFPTNLPIASNKYIRLEYLSDYSFALVPNDLHPMPGFRVPLFSENGIELDILGYPIKAGIPSSVLIRFDTTHIEQKLFSLSDFTMLLSAIVPIFQVDVASLKDEYQTKVSHPKGGYSSEQPKYFQTPDHRSYAIGLGWLTYYGPTLLNYIGRKRFDKLKTCAEKIEFHNGILVVLQEEPFDTTNLEHLTRKKQAEAELGFDQLLGTK